MLKRCPKCEIQKDVITEFHVNRQAYDGLCTYCKTCSNEINRTVQARNQPARLRNWARKIADHLHLNDNDY